MDWMMIMKVMNRARTRTALTPLLEGYHAARGAPGSWGTSDAKRLATRHLCR